MKKLNKILAIVIAFFFTNTAFATNVSSAANGSISNSGTWNSTPTNFDTVYIDHDLYFTGTQNWRNSTINAVIIRSGGELGPDGNNSVLILPYGTALLLEVGGTIINVSGNSSNHGIIIGWTCVWGKKCCAGSDSIQGPSLLDTANPCGYTPLPVHLLSFGGKRIDAGAVRITWSTASEEQNKKFIVEYSTDGKYFVSIGEVASAAAAGNSQNVLNYEFIDKRIATAEETSFYRIKQIDLNGDVGLISNIIIVKNLTDGGNILPVVISQSLPENNISLYINPDLDGISYTIEIYSLFGQKIFSQTGDKSGFQNLAGLSLKNGMYVVQIHFADVEETISQKILVQ